MERRTVSVPGRRSVAATLDAPDAVTEAAVAACPPHPRHGGSRSDGRLTAVSEALAGRGTACLRFDYGPWAAGSGERDDALAAVRWLRGRYGRVGLFGYSFGAGVALLAAAAAAPPPAAVSVLSPPARVDDLDPVAALDSLADADVPVQVVYGSRDDTVDWEPVADRVRALGDAGHDVELAEFGADHFFVGQRSKVADVVGEFFERRLRETV